MDLPRFIEADIVNDLMEQDDILIIDISIPQIYQEGHIPGAVHLPYPKIVFAHDNVDCDIPSDQDLCVALSSIGLEKHHHVITYDSQYNPMASRLCWTLEELGHNSFSIINGGRHAWIDAELPLQQEPVTRDKSDYQASQSGLYNATLEYIRDRLGSPDTVILDTRMLEEFTNELVMTDRGGKIPGAIHHDWMDNINEEDSFRLVDDTQMLNGFEKLGVTPDREIIVYCQTHLRSSHTYQVLKHLGFENVKGYAAGYAEWGNDENCQIQDEVAEDD